MWSFLHFPNEFEDLTMLNIATCSILPCFWKSRLWKKEGPVQIITFIRLNIREKNHFDLTWDVANKTCQRLSKLFPWSRRFEHVASDFSAFLGSWQLPAPLGGCHAGCGMRTSAKSRVLKPPARWGPLTKSLGKLWEQAWESWRSVGFSWWLNFIKWISWTYPGNMVI